MKIHLHAFWSDVNYNLHQSLYKRHSTLHLFIFIFISLLAPHSSPRHIIVQTQGKIFSCTVLDENLEPLTPPEIER